MSWKKKLVCLCLSVLVLSLFLGVFSYAEEETPLPTPESYVEDVVDALPPEIEELLPEGESYEEIAKHTDTQYLLSLSLTFLKKALSSMATYLSLFVSILLLGALAQRIEEAFGSSENSLASFVALLLVAFEAFSVLYMLFSEVLVYCERINGYMLTLNGVMGSVSLLGGNLSQAMGGTLALGITVSLLGSLITVMLLPVVRISFACSLTSVVSKRVNLSSLASFVRGFFTFIMGFISTVSVVALTFQTMLAQAADTLAARSIRFAASTSIPIVGGAVSDSVRTLGAAVSVIQKSVGTVGMTGLLIMTLYPLSVLFSAKIALLLSQTAAGILGIERASTLLAEVGHMINMLMATVAMLSVLYIFVIALFAGSGVAIE